ncbi:hypothetical protein AAKU67_002242 [Oxalobacteraceae bacterium GrIS 2.11]
MLESDIEAYLVNRCKKLGVHRDKFSSPQKRNVPDDILTFRGSVIFLELKATGKRPSEAQQRDHWRRIEAGACVLWTDSVEGVDIVLYSMLAQRPVPYMARMDAGGVPYKVDDGSRRVRKGRVNFGD